MVDIEQNCMDKDEIPATPAMCRETASGTASVREDTLACAAIKPPFGSAHITDRTCKAVKQAGDRLQAACTYTPAIPTVPAVPYIEETCSTFMFSEGGLDRLRDALEDITREGQLHAGGMRVAIREAVEWSLVTYGHAENFHLTLPAGNPSRKMITEARSLIDELLTNANDGSITDVMFRQYAHEFNKNLGKEASVTQDSQKACYGLPGLPRMYGANLDA
jgi:hypothetical protein